MSADINLENIGATFHLDGGVNLGLEELGNVHATLGGALGLGLGLDNVRVKEIGPLKFELSVKDLPLLRSESKVDLGLDQIKIQELPPIKLELGIRPVCVRLPVDYEFCVKVLGFPLLKFSIKGEALVVTEDPPVRPAERVADAASAKAAAYRAQLTAAR
jgi:hypothetical protein